MTGGDHTMEPITEQILERFETLAPNVRIYQLDPYFAHASIYAEHDKLWLSCSQRGTVRLEYIDLAADTKAQLILSAEHVPVELIGHPSITGLLVYVAERIVPDLDDRFHEDSDIIRAKQSETYQKLIAGETDVLSVIHKLEPHILDPQ